MKLTQREELRSGVETERNLTKSCVSEIQLWLKQSLPLDLQSHEPINLPFLLNPVECRFLTCTCITRWIPANCLPQEHRVGQWGAVLVPVGTLNTGGRWPGYYRKGCTDPHLILLTFPWLLYDFTSGECSQSTATEHIPLIHSTMAQEPPAL